MSQRSTTPLHAVARPGHTCPLCGGTRITTSCAQHTFRYGSGEGAVDLTVNVPVRLCPACEFEFLDEEAERLKHQAVCEHLGVLAPADIRRIRTVHGMTRARFARVTGLGEASLSRWENGVLIQTVANDRYIRLLARPEIMQVLTKLGTGVQDWPSASTAGVNQFRVLNVSDDMRRAQDTFQLRLVG